MAVFFSPDPTQQDIRDFMDEDERLHWDSQEGTPEDRVQFWENLESLWRSIPDPTEAELRQVMRDEDWKICQQDARNRESILNFYRRKWKKDRKADAKQSQLHSENPRTETDEPKGVRVHATRAAPTEQEQRRDDLLAFMPKQIRDEYERADWKRKTVLWAANEQAFDAAQKREEQRLKNEQERMAKILDALQRAKEDPRMADYLPPDNASMAELEKWYEDISKPVRIPFPNLSERQIRRERMERDIYLKGHPDPKDVAAEEAEEIRHQLSVAKARDKAHKEIEKELSRPATAMAPASVQTKEIKDSKPPAFPAKSRILDRFPLFHWLARHPKINFWSGVGMLAFAIGTELSGPSLKAAMVSALAYAASWVIWSLVIYHSELWTRRRLWAIAAIAVLAFGLSALWTVLRPDNPGPPPSAREIASEVSKQIPSDRAEGFLQFDRIEILRDTSYLVAGKQFGGNFYSRNPGPTRVFNAFGYSQAYVIKVDGNAETDRKVQYLFEQDLAPVRESYLAGRVKGPEQGIGEGIWTTVLSPALTQDDVDGILVGSVRIYFVTWLAWSNRQGQNDHAYDCRWLQGHTLPAPYKKENIVWHFCQHCCQ